MNIGKYTFLVCLSYREEPLHYEHFLKGTLTFLAMIEMLGYDFCLGWGIESLVFLVEVTHNFNKLKYVYIDFYEC